MAAITFSASGSQYVGTFRATEAVKIQIEGAGGYIQVGIKATNGTQYDDVEGGTFLKEVKCFDLRAEVYPVDVQVICAKKPTLATYTTTA